MADSEDILDKTVMSIMTALIGIILIASAFIPTVIDQITALSQLSSVDGIDIGQITGLMGIVATIVILGIIIGVVRSYTLKSR